MTFVTIPHFLCVLFNGKWFNYRSFTNEMRTQFSGCAFYLNCDTISLKITSWKTTEFPLTMTFVPDCDNKQWHADHFWALAKIGYPGDRLAAGTNLISDSIGPYTMVVPSPEMHIVLLAIVHWKRGAVQRKMEFLLKVDWQWTIKIQTCRWFPCVSLCHQWLEPKIWPHHEPS